MLSIPHDELLKSVARRIVDRHVLRLIKPWLKAPIEERDEVEPDRLYFSALVNGSSRRIHATTWGNGPNEGSRKPKPAAFSVECASMTARTSG